jgi:hypothetical protein
MKLKAVIMLIIISLSGQINCPWACADTIYTDFKTGVVGYTLITTTPRGDEIRMKYQATLKSENKMQRTFDISVITHHKNATLLGENRDQFELNKNFRDFFKDRDADASFMIELLYPTGRNVYSRREVMQGFTRPTGLTKIQVLKYPVYSNVGNAISSIKSGVLIKAESVCYVTMPNMTIYHLLSGDYDQTLFRSTECMEVNPTNVVFNPNGEISTIRGK